MFGGIRRGSPNLGAVCGGGGSELLTNDFLGRGHLNCILKRIVRCSRGNKSFPQDGKTFEKTK